MVYTLFNSSLNLYVTFEVTEEGDIELEGDPFFTQYFKEQLEEVFDYFGPEGYEPILLEERPDLLLAFLLRYTDYWELSPSPFVQG